MKDTIKKSSEEKDYFSLVKSVYRDKGIRPLAKAMTEASLIWKKPKPQKIKQI